MSSTRSRGAQAESLALDYLQRRGLKLVTRNYYCRLGEIDLVMQDEEHHVFVEVRYRENTRFGSSAESVNASKQRKLIVTAQHFLQSFAIDTPCRFDVVAITKKDQINWIKNAFCIV